MPEPIIPATQRTRIIGIDISAAGAAYHLCGWNLVCPVTNAVDRHRSLVALDEALFDDEGQPLVDSAQIAASEDAMASAWRDLMAVPCRTLTEVRIKVEYVLHGTLGDRDLILFDLTGPQDHPVGMYAPDACLPLFLRSLLGLAPIHDGAPHAPSR